MIYRPRLLHRAPFQLTAARRRLAGLIMPLYVRFVSTHSRPKAAGTPGTTPTSPAPVSTHSRPKAAGYFVWASVEGKACFNSQPPEGGWLKSSPTAKPKSCFNSQPPEGGWQIMGVKRFNGQIVSTHSRPKAAGRGGAENSRAESFQLTAARRRLDSRSIQ